MANRASRELVIKSQDRRITQSGNSALLLLITDEVDRIIRPMSVHDAVDGSSTGT
jgi:hypothetical protein